MLIKVERKVFDKKKLAGIFLKLKEILEEEKLPVFRIYLFGSYARGTAHKDSDIDIAIVLPKKEDITQEQLDTLTAKIKRAQVKLQPHFMTKADLDNKFSTFAEEVKKGQIIYKK